LFTETLGEYLKRNRENGLKNIINYNKTLANSAYRITEEVEKLFGKTMPEGEKIDIIMSIIKSIKK